MEKQMMTLNLNGAWRMAWCPVGQGTMAGFRALPSLPCQVPGAVHTAFIEAGMIPEPLKDREDEKCRWLETQEFWYSRCFDRPEALGEKQLLRFDGLDTAADIWLNGVFLGHCSNAFIHHEFDVTEALRPGENELIVRLDQGLREVMDKPMEQMGVMWNNAEPRRAWMRKPQYVYGWDWTIWLPTCGIWRDVTLQGCEGAYMQDLHAHTPGPLTEGRPAQVTLDFEAAILSAGPYTAEYTIADGAGAVVAAGTSPVQPGTNRLETVIPEARLWQPRGFGEAHCYEVTVHLRDERGRIRHTLGRTLGLRTVSLREETLNEQESGFTFIINGNPVFCKGANVVPADCLLGRVTNERERALVALAAEANMNMLRIWGGGVYASEAFLEACDRAGILVWHDFMYACGYYPDHDADFLANVTREAGEAIRRLRNHPSVIGWSGNNEIQEMYLSQQKWMEDFPFYGEKLYTELLPRLVRDLHPGAIYRESSPLGDPEDPAGSLRGDQHIWHFTHRPNDPHYLDLWRFTDFPVKFLSEFGVIGAMTKETTEETLSPEHRDPEDPVWLFHTNDSQEHGLLNRFMEVYFGGYRGLSLQQYILRSQAIQAEILRHIYDEFRARKFVCSGLLFWTLGDSMGIHNWSLIDYALRRKPAYHAMKRAMAPVVPVIRGYEVQSFRGMEGWREHWANHPEPLTLWAVNDTLEARPVDVRWRIMTLEGAVLRQALLETLVPANASHLVCEVPLDGLTIQPEKTILHVSLVSPDGTVTENRYFFAPYREMLTKHAAPRWTMERCGTDTFRLRITSEVFVWQLHIAEPEGVTASDNDFDLIPGESRTITIRAGEGYQPELHWVGEE